MVDNCTCGIMTVVFSEKRDFPVSYVQGCVKWKFLTQDKDKVKIVLFHLYKAPEKVASNNLDMSIVIGRRGFTL